MLKTAYTFDDVALVPQFNNITSRTHPDLSSWLTKERKVEIPLLAANMDAVIGEELADVLIEKGSVPIFHRFAPMTEQERWVKKYEHQVFVSSGLRSLDETRKLLDLGAGGVCIDVAHGHSHMMLEFIRELKRTHERAEVIAGNACTAMAYHDLVNAGADAVKVGIGPGSACTTRVVTGFGVPQFTAIRECAMVASRLRVPLIADGGIETGRDVVLALAAGANTVMIGKRFAATAESAAPKEGGKAKYRGQASLDFQEEYYGGLREKTVAEGVEFWLALQGGAGELIDELLGAIRSGLTYGGARNIKELQRKAEFVAVTPSYQKESGVRND